MGKGKILKSRKKYSVNREKYLEFSKNWENSGGKKLPKLWKILKKWKKYSRKLEKILPQNPKSGINITFPTMIRWLDYDKVYIVRWFSWSSMSWKPELMEVKTQRSRSRSNMESKVKSFRPQRQRLQVEGSKRWRYI